MTEFKTKIAVPQGIQAEVVDNTVKIKGIKGELSRAFVNPRLVMNKTGEEIFFTLRPSFKFSQKDKMVFNTYRAHVRNMFKGVQEGYTAKLKICSGHFPMTVTMDGNTIVVKNFLGEKIPRKSSLSKEVKIQIQGEIITVTGIDKELVGQAAATIEQTTRVTNRDRRIFQDGCYITLKPGESNE
jgi:large subunit ribosomal protein L6